MTNIKIQAGAMAYHCPVCGEYIFDEGPGSFDICPVCEWEDDPVQAADPDYSGGANHLSLNEYKERWRHLHEESES